MKTILCAMACVVAASLPAHAGSLADTIVEPTPERVTPAEPGPSVSNWLVPVLLVTLLVGVAVVTDQAD